MIYAFVVYDARGLTKMAAVASFVDSAHAAKAVELYNGKVIDGSELIATLGHAATQLMCRRTNSGRANRAQS